MPISHPRVEMPIHDAAEKQAGELFDYLNAAAFALPGKRDHQVAAWVAQGFAEGVPVSLGSHDIMRRFGGDRRVACKTRQRLLQFRFIVEVAQDEKGLPRYAPCLERGREWRARIGETRHAA